MAPGQAGGFLPLPPGPPCRCLFARRTALGTGRGFESAGKYPRAPGKQSLGCFPAKSAEILPSYPPSFSIPSLRGLRCGRGDSPKVPAARQERTETRRGRAGDVPWPCTELSGHSRGSVLLSTRPGSGHAPWEHSAPPPSVGTTIFLEPACPRCEPPGALPSAKIQLVAIPRWKPTPKSPDCSNSTDLKALFSIPKRGHPGYRRHGGAGSKPQSSVHG